MPSPFPGMNPYLEQPSVWHDFHESFLPVAREMLSAQVLPRYFVKIDEHIYIHEVTDDQRRYAGRSDLFVAPLALGGGDPAAGTQVLPAPARVTAPFVDEESQSYLQILDRETREVITVVELLSPSNKYAGPDREQYLAKWRRVLRSGAHLVEIDLLRGGPRMPWGGMPPCDYCVVVSRAGQRPHADGWPLRLRDPLPEVPVPLRAGEADARLDLKAILDHVYDAAGYGYYIYSGRPEPLLSAEDDAWAATFVPATPTGP